jgi:glycosyltransferase involved in cell wall biosynthesis
MSPELNIRGASGACPLPEIPDVRRSRLRILLLRVRILHPLNVGSKIRTAKLVEQLSRKHDVTLVSYRYPDDRDEDLQATLALCRRLETLPIRETPKKTPAFYFELARNLLDPRPYMIAKYSTREMERLVERVYREEKPDLVICDFPHSCEGLRRLPGVPFLLFQHNVEAHIFEQLAQRANTRAASLYLRLQARKMRRYERKQCLRAARVIAVSDADRGAYANRYGLPSCDVIPTGVDVDHFLPGGEEERADSLVFTGSMDWMANQDAIHHFVSTVLPLIRKRRPEVSLTVVGRCPPPDVVELGRQPGIEVTGTVPDIRPFVHRSQLFVVPLRIGSGTRLKLVEAMAMGKAIVSTTIGAEGLPFENGKDILIADEPQDFADAVVSLLEDPERRRRMGLTARIAAEDRHAWTYVGNIFTDICDTTARDIRGRHVSRNPKRRP